MNLDDADSMRVIPDADIVDSLRARCGDFTPNPGALDAEQIATLISTIHSANRADDPASVAAHAVNVDRASRRFMNRFRWPSPGTWLRVAERPLRHSHDLPPWRSLP